MKSLSSVYFARLMFLKSHDWRSTEISGGEALDFCYGLYRTNNGGIWKDFLCVCVCVCVCVWSLGHLELICVLLSHFPCQASGQFLQVKLKLVQADVAIFSGSEG